MWTRRFTASVTAVDQLSVMRSSSSSAISVRIPIAKRPIAVDPSKLSSTETRRAPASFNLPVGTKGTKAQGEIDRMVALSVAAEIREGTSAPRSISLDVKLVGS
jgi:hypothetical protein